MSEPADPVLTCETAEAPVLSARRVSRLWEKAEKNRAALQWSDLQALVNSHESLRAQLTAAQQERDAALKLSEIRQRMIDIPTAWELTLATPKGQHHERCSYRTAAMLCDCAAARVMEFVSGLLSRAAKRAESAEALCRSHAEEVERLKAELEELKRDAR